MNKCLMDEIEATQINIATMYLHNKEYVHAKKKAPHKFISYCDTEGQSHCAHGKKCQIFTGVMPLSPKFNAILEFQSSRKSKDWEYWNNLRKEIDLEEKGLPRDSNTIWPDQCPILEFENINGGNLMAFWTLSPSTSNPSSAQIEHLLEHLTQYGKNRVHESPSKSDYLLALRMIYPIGACTCISSLG